MEFTPELVRSRLGSYQFEATSRFIAGSEVVNKDTVPNSSLNAVPESLVWSRFRSFEFGSGSEVVNLEPTPESVPEPLVRSRLQS
uniref:Uncharacterized protein n=1 Tax=Anopheles minimus TaxID=112268 RepID=A0A182WMN6_9DIPT